MKIIILLLLIVSCSSHKKNESSSVYTSVDVFQEKDKPYISKKSDSIGPENMEQAEDKTSGPAKVISLYFSPGLNRSFSHIAFIRSANDHKFKGHIISGGGIGAVIATMHSFGITPEVMEWRLFKFLREKNVGTNLYNEKWRKSLLKNLLPELLDKNIRDSVLKLVIPLWDNEEKIIKWIDRGNVGHYLDLALRLNYQSKDGLSSVIEGPQMNKDYLEKIGSDISYAIWSAGINLRLKKSSDYLVGIYGKVFSVYKSSENNFDHSIILPTDDFLLDGDKDIPRLLSKVYDFSFTKLDEIIKKEKEN